MKTVQYQVNAELSVADVIRVFNASGIVRPTQDAARIEKMFAQANLVVSAWHEGALVGVARGLTDHSYCCYLSDLAVDQAYQRQGIGGALLAQSGQVNPPPAATAAPVPKAPNRSVVAFASDPRAMVGFDESAPVTSRMVNALMRTITGHSDTTAAWRAC